MLVHQAITQWLDSCILIFDTAGEPPARD